LTELLKKGAWKWNAETEQAFRRLQTVLTTAYVLALTDFSKHFGNECDTSGKGLGAVPYTGKATHCLFQ
jgi:hypothetical protein